MPKILYLVTEDWFFISHFVPMARAAAKAGFEVIVATRINNEGSAITRAGFRLVEIASDRKSLGLITGFNYLIRVYALIRDERPDIVHCIALRSVVLGGVAAKLAGTNALVLAPTGLGYLWLRRGFLTGLVRAAVRMVIGSWLRGPCTRYVFENRDDPAEFGIDPAAADVVVVGGAGVDAKDFPVTPEPLTRPVKAAVVARMIRPKGIEEAVEAARRARAQGADLELHLFGDPDPSNPTSLTEAELRRYSSEPGIYWHGRVTDVARVWREHHIALLLSHGGEGLPRTLVEAAASGRPIVTTDVAGCREVVRGQEGFLVRPGDIEAAARALAAMAGNAALRQRMGAAAHARFSKCFTEAAVTEEVGRLYRSVLARR